MITSTERMLETRCRSNFTLVITKIRAPATKFTLQKNCLPGSGWEPVHSTQVQIGSVDGVPVLVNGYLVAQGAKRDMVLYWYQSHGRIVASEYWAKFWLVADALKRRPTDGAMIRIWTTASDGEATAQARAVGFAHLVYLQVAEFLPE